VGARFPAGDEHPLNVKPLKLAWEIPTETREVPLTFEFKDLPLP